MVYSAVSILLSSMPPFSAIALRVVVALMAMVSVYRVLREIGLKMI
jgi:hypothetical protein